MRTAVTAFFAGVAILASAWGEAGWTQKVPGIGRKVLPKAAALTENGQLLVLVWGAVVGENAKDEGVWLGDPAKRQWQQVLSGKFWALAPAQVGSFWVVPRLSQHLEQYTYDGKRLATTPVGQPVLDLIRSGKDFLFLRTSMSGSGKLLWRGQPGSFRPWALDPTPAADLESLTKANMYLFAADADRTVVLNPFNPRELVLLSRDGQVINTASLDRLLKEQPHETPVVDLELQGGTVLLLARGEGDARRLWSLTLASGQLTAEDAPAGARLVVRGGEFLLVDATLQVWGKTP